MSGASDLRSGKGHKDENFPVASRLIHPRHRAPILAFYNFVRTADDIADHATLSEADKLAHLDRLEQSLLGQGTGEAAGVALHAALKQRGLGPQHAQDLLTAFRLDVTKHRYADWDDLIGYCRYSAMPVGRYVLDVHGESRATWPANDALCAALQVINHLQDCGKDYRDLDRVYVPLDALQAAGASVEEIGAARASPALAACLHGLAGRTGELLRESAAFAPQIADLRLAMEVSVIQTLAERLVAMLSERDPLSERVHLGKGAMAGLALAGVVRALFGRLRRPRAEREGVARP
ncbi:MAG: squalene synthase HpnC [Variibacter sp.]|nr:squalene synthase HpnC [Variibacter sp.]